MGVRPAALTVSEWDRAVRQGRVLPHTFRGAVAVAFAMAVQESAGASVALPGRAADDEAAPAAWSMPQAFARVCDELVRPGGPAWSGHRVGDVARGKRDLTLEELSDLTLGGSPFRDLFRRRCVSLDALLFTATDLSRHPEKPLADVRVIRAGRASRPPITGGRMTPSTLTAPDMEAITFQTQARRNALAAFSAGRFTEARLWNEAADAVERAVAAGHGPPATRAVDPIEWARWALAQRKGAAITPKEAEAMVRAFSGRDAAPTNQQLGTSLSDMLKAKHPEVKRVGRGQYVATEWLKPPRMGGPTR